MYDVGAVAESQIRRHDRLGVPGYDVVCAASVADRVWQALRSAGAGLAGKEAWDMLRIEAGTPEQGIDIDEDNLVMELGRTDRAICYTKGCFLGQEPIVRARDLGHVNWSLRGLRIAGGEAVPRGAKLVSDGEEVGRVTSAATSPRFGHAIALAFVRRGTDTPGTRLEVSTDNGRRAAEVCSLPFSG